MHDMIAACAAPKTSGHAGLVDVLFLLLRAASLLAPSYLALAAVVVGLQHPDPWAAWAEGEVEVQASCRVLCCGGQNSFSSGRDLCAWAVACCLEMLSWCAMSVVGEAEASGWLEGMPSRR